MQRLKVGIIGTGMAFEHLHYSAYMKLTDRYEIAALCDGDIQKARNWAIKLNLDKNKVYDNWQEMLAKEDLDVIDIMVPIELNFEVTEGVAKQLAGKNKGIICEKPLAPTLDQAQAARDLAQKYNIPIMIAENYRYNEEIDMIRDMVRNKYIGEVYYFMQNRVIDTPGDMVQDKFSAKEWRQHPEFPGGVITDTGVHDIAALHHIFGPIDKLQSFGRPQKAEFAPYSVVNVNMQFKSGVTGQFSFFCAGKEMQRPFIGLRIFGTEGMLYLEERDAGTINVAFNDGRQERIPYEAQKGFYNELLNFHNAMMGIEPVSVSPELEYGDLKAMHDIFKSIHENAIITVDEDAEYRPDYRQPQFEQQAPFRH